MHKTFDPIDIFFIIIILIYFVVLFIFIAIFINKYQNIDKPPKEIKKTTHKNKKKKLPKKTKE